MSWDFETDPDFRQELDWIEQFVRDEIEPLDHVVRHSYQIDDPVRAELIPPLQAKVRGYQPAEGLFPSRHRPALRAQARERYADVLTRHEQPV